METSGSIDLFSLAYAKLKNNVINYQRILGRGLTASEKILVGHSRTFCDFYRTTGSNLE